MAAALTPYAQYMTPQANKLWPVLKFLASHQKRQALRMSNHRKNQIAKTIRAGRLIQRVYRGYRSRKKTKLAKRMSKEPRLASNAKQSAVTGSPTGLNMGFLYSHVIPYPALSADPSTITQRQNNCIRVKGIKICRSFYYNADYGTADQAIGPIQVNWALVQLKDRTAQISESIQNFFRDHSSTNARAKAFIPYLANSSWSLEYNCLPMNPNSNFNILTRWKRTIYPRASGGADLYKTHWKIEKYFPIKKNQRFDASNSTNPQMPIYEIYWYNTVNDSQFPADPTAYIHVVTNHSNTIYYHEAFGSI